MPKKYNKDQLQTIRTSLVDSDIMGLGQKESIAYVKSRLGGNVDFTEWSYLKYRREALNTETNLEWITYYAREGFVNFYRKRIAEMEMIQKSLLKKWLVEDSKPYERQNNNLIIKLTQEIRANNQRLESLGMVTPIIATIKTIIDKEKVDNASKFIYPIQYQTSGETTDTGETETFELNSEPSDSADGNRQF